jgi:AhpD family alkylhydroperoxidase
MRGAKAVLEELREPGRDLRSKIPEVYSSFASLDHAVMTEGALSVKTKQLVALAISVVRECDGCVASHARDAFRAGATEDEVAEVLGVTIQMSGGPGLTWAPRAFAAYKEYASASL